MPLLTRDDLRRQSPLAWASILALLGVAFWFWTLEKGNAAGGTALAALGCLGLILPPRERMGVLPRRIRALPRGLDAVPALASLVSSPGYGLNWFYGQNPYDEVVHLVSGGLSGAVFLALLAADGRPRGRLRLVLAATLFGLNLGTVWEAFEYATGLIGDWTDTWTDVVLTTLGAALAGLLWPRR
ncbi:hypothetical protein VQH23_20275 [Pararoseomonas sp. SCSIO 73927]|uniref:hypothetical protein n=1 Tax=Pararoseomonas sp. SCSIO 73927 TaxID=3114537 RepID=UPI0030D5D9CE